MLTLCATTIFHFVIFIQGELNFLKPGEEKVMFTEEGKPFLLSSLIGMMTSTGTSKGDQGLGPWHNLHNSL